jgi:mono/diheme cytochrome c family protein
MNASPRSTRLAAVRRLLPLLGIALLAGCGGEKTVSPTAKEVVGTLPTTTQAAIPKGDATAGAALFKSQGCTGCHTFNPAGSNANVGPDLDKLADYAQKANEGSLEQFTFDSIKNPAAYLESGYNNVMPNFGQSLTDKQIADLTAYLTKG